MKATLQVFDSQSEEPQVFVAELPVTVGRGPEAEIRLDDWWISRAHCQIDEVDGSLVVRDLGSKHGTLVNRHSIVESPLSPEDELLIGLTSLRVRLDREEDSHSLLESSIS
jgi:pSer/pThr/pTyr-binding forkhead associated (FHA) protein